MSATTIKMVRDHSGDIEEIITEFKYSIGGDYISEVRHESGEMKAVLLSFEKFFFRTGGYTGLTVMFVEQKDMQYADIVGFGGGEGLLNISYGANLRYATDAADLLQQAGFQELSRE